jgi:dihydrofolate reductase
MGRLIYLMLMSLDGYIEDPSGSFAWAEPDAEVHAFVNDLSRPVGTHLYGRRMYEVMSAWQTLGDAPDDEPHIADFGRIWRAADKVVYSSTLEVVGTPRTRLERRFDADAVRSLKASSDRDISIGGPDLAAQAFEAGVVDTVHLFVTPVAVGGGKAALPKGLRLDLTLEATRRFGNGMAHLQYGVRSDPDALVR